MNNRAHNDNTGLLDKQIGVSTLLALITLAVGLVAAWTRMEMGLVHIEKSVENNKQAILANIEVHKDILAEVKESNRIVGARVDRLLELELQSRRSDR